VATNNGTGTGYDPAGAAVMLDHLKITITVPWSDVAWAKTGWFIETGSTITAVTYFYSTRNVPLSVSTVLPDKPLKPTDPLP
jgi:hypothetical protein